jgi:hypothetical protein
MRKVRQAENAQELLARVLSGVSLDGIYITDTDMPSLITFLTLLFQLVINML